MKTINKILFLALAMFVLFLGAYCMMSLGVFADESDNSVREYPYDGEQFNEFIAASYFEAGRSDTEEFYAYMEEGYKNWTSTDAGKVSFLYDETGNSRLEDVCDIIKSRLNVIADRSLKTEDELKILTQVHKFIKTAIPKFSLQRGYEFTDMAQYGERQCFLQSVLIAGILQRMGINAGVAMVYINKKGEYINNAHAVTLVKLSNGKDIIVDASEKEPFDKHLGLFCGYDSSYKYVVLFFDAKIGYEIDYYNTWPESARNIPISKVLPLDVKFIQSQFDSYRGEWAAGGLRDAKKTKKGLEAAAKYFKRALETCPGNPLPAYFLARCYEELGDKPNAKKTFSMAYKLYSKYGFVPEGVKKRAK